MSNPTRYDYDTNEYNYDEETDIITDNDGNVICDGNGNSID